MNENNARSKEMKSFKPSIKKQTYTNTEKQGNQF